MFWLGSAYYVSLPGLYSFFLSLRNCTGLLFLPSYSIKLPSNSQPSCMLDIKNKVPDFLSHLSIRNQTCCNCFSNFLKTVTVFIKCFDYRNIGLWFYGDYVLATQKNRLWASRSLSEKWIVSYLFCNSHHFIPLVSTWYSTEHTIRIKISKNIYYLGLYSPASKYILIMNETLGILLCFGD